MQDDDRPSSNPPEVQLTTIDDADVPELIALPVTVHTAALIRVCQLIEQRIPGYTHLTLSERRSMARAGNLDPEFIAEGVAAALAAGDQAPKLTAGMTAEECQELAEQIRSDEELERAYRVLIEGIAATNLKRRHRLGRAMLHLYAQLGVMLQDIHGRWRHLQPYHDRMKRASRKNRKGGGKAKGETATPETGT